MSKELIDALVDKQEQEAIEIAKGLLEGGEDPLEIMDACREAMATVGKRFEKGEFFLSELVLAGEILRQISDIVKPKLKGDVEAQRLGKVII